VDFGVAEEPEEMLEQHPIAATFRGEKVVPKLRSVRGIVIAPASTGSDTRYTAARGVAVMAWSKW